MTLAATTRRLQVLPLALALAFSGCAVGVSEEFPGDPPEDAVGAPVAADPSLFGEGKYAAAADIKAATDSGENIVFVDARTVMDYEFGHIPGAISVPYFEAEDRYSELPTDRWIITYCECPHAEAEQVADVLLANGYTMVKVMDEGLQGWRDLGGAVEGGAPPVDG